eukprot:GHVS01019107.1.p2 GENE.GHVS01019107.1~~GHVS01019107.1.p2  ORF type:complete len:222 (-),score=52.12 GHVS01019107.1:89-754(-)
MALKHVEHRRVHLERHQPARRKKLGLLEKHKDYVERAKQQHKREDILKRLQEKARQKNAAEFNFKMLGAVSKEKGVVMQGRPTPKQRLMEEKRLKEMEHRKMTKVGSRGGKGWGVVEEEEDDVRFLRRGEKKVRERLVNADINVVRQRKTVVDKQLGKKLSGPVGREAVEEMGKQLEESRRMGAVLEKLEKKKQMADVRAQWKERVPGNKKQFRRFSERKK